MDRNKQWRVEKWHEQGGWFTQYVLRKMDTFWVVGKGTCKSVGYADSVSELRITSPQTCGCWIFPDASSLCLPSNQITSITSGQHYAVHLHPLFLSIRGWMIPSSHTEVTCSPHANQSNDWLLDLAGCISDPSFSCSHLCHPLTFYILFCKRDLPRQASATSCSWSSWRMYWW